MNEDVIEAVARALLREEYGSEPSDVPNLYARALSSARIAIRAYEAARGDVVVPTLHDLVCAFEDAERQATKADDLRGDPSKWGTVRGIKAVRAMIAASQGER